MPGLCYLFLLTMGFQGLPQVCIHDACYTVELARTPDARARGLMHRTALAPDAGMLFCYPAAAYPAFWMKNTLIPLDIIWISNELKIVHIAHRVPPCRGQPCPRYRPRAPARYVLEINAGHGAGLRPGDPVVLRGVE